MSDYDRKISEFIRKDISEKPVARRTDPFWESLRKAGTSLWLDTGDMEEAGANWTDEMSALTTNNTLINNEIQKGIYDDFIAEARTLVRRMPVDEQVKEIAFMLNARHGLRLAARFGGYVSVELHTGTAHDIKAIEYYGKRYFELNPQQFLVKVPYTATGLLGARLLKNAGIKINLTLEFSARENVLVTRIARPDYANVFLGRIGAYMVNNKLGDGSGAGEMAVLSSQKWITKLAKLNPWQTKLIAASLRNFEQLELLAGTDVYTMPPKVAAAGRTNLKGKFTVRLNEQYPVNMTDDGRKSYVEKFWEVDKKTEKFANMLADKLPSSGDEIVQRAHEAGCGDMFPHLSAEEMNWIGKDGKIPVYSRWEKKIGTGEIAPDTLLTLAGLASFTSDQGMLDNRIKGIIS